MRSVRQRATAPERALAQALQSRGIAFESQRAIVPGVRRLVDFVLARHRIAIFIDGCFWHSCPLHASKPRAHALAWQQKLAANQDRDADTNRRLHAAGWVVLRFWEHETADEMARAIVGLVAAWEQEAEELNLDQDGSST